MGLERIPHEAIQSGKNVIGAGKAGFNRNPKGGIVGRPVDAVTGAATQAVIEGVRMPFAAVVRPTGSFLLNNTGEAVKGAVLWTLGALASLPLIPFRTSEKAK